MVTVVILLRGINVGGHHKVKMSELSEYCTQLGAHEVSTYIQSGNIVCQLPASALADFPQRLSHFIASKKGFSPDAILITKSNFQDILAQNPFSTLLEEDKHGHLFFFTAPILNHEAAYALLSPTEKIQFSGSILYLYAPDGIGRSKLAAKLDQTIGASSTARNWRTILKINDLLETQSSNTRCKH